MSRQILNKCRNYYNLFRKSKTREFVVACESLADMFYSTTSMMGCPPFKSAQQNACMCVENKDAAEQGKSEL